MTSKEEDPFRVVTGDILGLVKVWAPTSGKTLVRSGKPRRLDSIEALAWARETQEDAGVLAVLRESGLRLIRLPLALGATGPSTTEGKGKGKGKGKGEDKGKGDEEKEDADKTVFLEAPAPIQCKSVKPGSPCTGLDVLPDRVIVSSADGTVQIAGFDPDATKIEDVFGSSLISSHKLTGEAFSRMRLSPTSGLLAAGGKETLLSLWDTEKWQRCFHAKNVAHDYLDMRIPVWVTGICFMGPVENAEKGPKQAIGGGTPERVATCTGHGYVRLYDTRAQRRAVASVELKTATELYQKNVSAESRHLTSIDTIDEHTVAVGDAVGGLRCVDFRQGKVVKSFKSLNGSIRSVVKHPTLPLICAGGLDRHLVIGDLETGLVKSRIYARQQLTSMLFSSQAPPQPPSADESTEKKRHLEPIPDEDDVVGDFDEDDLVGDSDSDEDEDEDEDADEKKGSKAQETRARQSKTSAKTRSSQPPKKRRR
ncbi:Ribosome biosis protein nsa1 [Hondaea fermentalgiana]|uniref:Ribosome biosis protein nsa1 n=1 Tax=Hondaea fermentalgiana TaxID=2315210 RepID=A0A2R5GVG9_9STRA|nr:Ribosome biosis protein nsa1 [Hondaea fermentalgiana]|eukprot:GBG34837.1 Ribosome biosis protein nsa1 [Hondaea fermentalgiana]